MAQHPIKIKVINDPIGIPPSSDGIMGIFVKGIAVGSTLVLNTAYLLTKLSDLTDKGVDEAYDLDNRLAVYQQVSEFYAQAGDGALLWLFVVPTNTAYATYVASSTFSQLIQKTAEADPANRVKMIGLCYNVPTTFQNSSDFPVDVTNAITALQTAQENLFDLGYQFSGLIDGYNMSSSVTPSGLATMTTYGASAVSMCITGTKPNGVSAVGLALGRFARISIGHGFGSVEDGPIDTNTAFLTNGIEVGEEVISGTGSNLIVGKIYTVFGGAIVYNGVTYQIGDKFTCIMGFTTFTTIDDGYVATGFTTVGGLDPTDIDQLGAKQFLFLRTWFNHSGFYWNDGATCESVDKPLSTQEYNRVANALSADALNFFIDQMGKNLPLDTRTGAVDQGYLDAKQAQFYTQYISPLSVSSGTGDLSDGKIVITGPDFNVTKTLLFKLTIVPTPILGAVTGTVEFTSTL